MLQIVPRYQHLDFDAIAILRETFPSAYIRNVIAEDDASGAILLRAILTDVQPPAQFQLNRALRRMNALSERDVRLQIRFEQLYEAGATAAVMDSGRLVVSQRCLSSGVQVKRPAQNRVYGVIAGRQPFRSHR